MITKSIPGFCRKMEDEEGIKNLVKSLKVTINSREIAKQQLMELYCLREEEADEKIGKYW